ncbi:stanniocalcin family [Brachionus plicatilis]|uniref:Stanniocalcin family n=1 Tax=Brachionus plicatilis TaxID=10195 RepID=A0A3M7PPA9_BRAPC|nr:stanniocalcin family [Brachionus plicatilis]
MKHFQIFIILILYLSTTADELHDLAAKGDCKFYEVLESIEKCGPNGYLIAYGLKYCNKFTSNLNSFNEDGQLWVKSVKKCLMAKLIDKKFPTCKSLADYAFESHVDCYLNPGYEAKSFCDILFENVHAFTKIYELIDIIKQPFQSLRQIFTVLFKCISFKT